MVISANWAGFGTRSTRYKPRYEAPKIEMFPQKYYGLENRYNLYPTNHIMTMLR